MHRQRISYSFFDSSVVWYLVPLLNVASFPRVTPRDTSQEVNAHADSTYVVFIPHLIG